MINDEEIDLTEHRDFREHTDPLRLLVKKRIDNSIGNKFPWSISQFNIEPYKYDGLMAIGNALQRKMAVELKCWGTTENITCDCCGREYKKIPWKKNNGLCEECKKSFNERDFKILNW